MFLCRETGWSQKGYREVSMKKVFQWLRKSQRGQGATEYMLVLAVIVIALVAAAKGLIEPFRSGVAELASHIEETISGATID